MDIGKLDQVNLRDVWGKSAFTAWLTENLQQLGDAINTPLDLQGQEQWMGTFKADILARHAETEELVLIIHQEKADLGQIITYAAGLEANIVVWVAEHFAAEQRAAIDWLNRNTLETLQFFAVQIAVWKIGDSAIAPRFEVVAKPNNWARTVARSMRQEEKRVRVSDETILTFVTEHPDLKRAEVATQLGISERKVYGALARQRMATTETPSTEEHST